MPIRYLDEAPAAKGKVRFLDEEPLEANFGGKPTPVKVVPSKNFAFDTGIKMARKIFNKEEPLKTNFDFIENAAPATGQILGGITGGFGGAVAGATAGQGVSQFVKGMRGSRNSQPRKLFGVGPQSPGIVNDLVGEAAGSATIEGAFRGAGKLAKPVTNRLMIAALKPAKESIKRNPNFGLDAAEQGFLGTLGNMKRQAENVLQKTKPMVKTALKGKPQKVNALQVASELDELKRPFLNVGDETSAKAVDELQNALLSKADDAGLVPVQEANEFKQDLYTVLKDSQWGKGVGEIPVKATARKQAAYGLRKEIEGAVPEVGPLNKKIGTAVEALEGIKKQQEKNLMKVVLPFFETLGGVGGALTGNPWLTFGILARKGLMSPAGLSNMAQASKYASSPKFGRVATSGATELARRTFGGKE